jgi:hypothetical protein
MDNHNHRSRHFPGFPDAQSWGALADVHTEAPLRYPGPPIHPVLHQSTQV